MYINKNTTTRSSNDVFSHLLFPCDLQLSIRGPMSCHLPARPQYGTATGGEVRFCAAPTSTPHMAIRRGLFVVQLGAL
jgi:hypothetical protein